MSSRTTDGQTGREARKRCTGTSRSVLTAVAALVLVLAGAVTPAAAAGSHPAPAPAKAPAKAPAEAPAKAPAEAPVKAVVKAPVKALQRAVPVNAPDVLPDRTMTTLVTADTSGGEAFKAPPVPVVDVITVSPGSTHPGGSVDLRTFASCTSGSSVVTSSALAGPAVLAPAADGGLYAEGVVAAGAADGSYPLTETCGDRTTASGTLVVARIGALPAGGGWGAARNAARGAAGGVDTSNDDLRTTSAHPSAVDEFVATGLIGAALVAAALFGYQRRRTVGRG